MTLRLLAKSKRGARALTLFSHLVDTEHAAASLFRKGTRWADAYLRFFKLRPEDHERFLLHLRLAGLFHDIGKANEDFQAAVSATGFRAQSLRHEHLSGLLMAEPSLARWLAAGGRIDVDVLLAAVLSHHLKADWHGEFKVLQPRHKPPTSLFFSDAQITAALGRIAEIAALPPYTGKLPAPRYVDDAWTLAWQALWDRADAFDVRLRRDAQRLSLTLAVKAGLIVCDSVSSGLWREGIDIDAWVDAVAHGPALRPDDIDRDVLAPRAEELGAKWRGWHPFQERAATIGSRGLLLAACGAGKTLAAWRWAKAVAAEREIGRVVFLYPTRGTATEGFRDYVAHAPEGRAALVHGTSGYELAGMLANPDEMSASLKGKKVIPDENEARLFSLGLWDKRYFSATVDQFLGFIEHAYGGLCLIPPMADAALIFDEVHSYDPRMWNALVTFLTRFDVPVLCMTATLPPTRRNELEGAGLRVYPTAGELSELRDLENKETTPRYRIQESSESYATEAAIAAYVAGKRVLWVVNTVRRCQARASDLRKRLRVDVGVYHSRFKLDHRQRRHRETVDAFRSLGATAPGAAIAVTTQVCEMSLDLDADVLITEHAPVSSLVQRFGRAHRHLRADASFRAALLTYPPESTLPYESADLDAAGAFLRELAGRDVSQRDLAHSLERHARRERAASGRTAFVDGAFFAVSGMLRDAEDVGLPAVLDGDVDRYLTLEKQRMPTEGLRLTVPKKHARPSDGTGLPPWIHLAESQRYDPWLGFIVDDDLLQLPTAPVRQP
jgi:CRISPR-associated endonuclease/helicase Cas3